MICPDCKGKKVIVLWSSTETCGMCKGEGTVPDPVAAESFSPADWKPEEPQVFDPANLPIDIAAPPLRLKDTDFDYGCLLMVAKEDGLLYQANDKAGTCRCLGTELICSIDGYSTREKWADLKFCWGAHESIARLHGDSLQRQLCLVTLQARRSAEYRVKPAQIGNAWDVTVEEYNYFSPYQATDRLARAGYRVHPPVISRMVSEQPSVQNVSKEFYHKDLGAPYQATDQTVRAVQDKIIEHALKQKGSLFLEVPGGLGKIDSVQQIIGRLARPDEVYEYPFAKLIPGQ